MRKIKFPVIIYDKNHIRGNIINNKELRMMGEEALNENYLLNGNIIDSEGVEYLITSIKLNKKLFNFWGILGGSNNVLVDFEIKKTKKLNLDKLKIFIINKIKSNPKWVKNAISPSSCYDTEDQIYEYIKSCRTVKELIEHISVFD